MRSEQPATPELQLLRYLVTVADEGGMTRAARRLHLTQQALSSGIKRLETVARVSLVDRSTHPVSLTPAGEVFVVRARRALAEAEHAVADAQAVSRGGSGRLVVGVVAGVGTDHATRLMDWVRGHYPNMVLELREFDFRDPSAGLRDGQSDVAVVTLPLATEGLQLRSIRVEPRVVALAGTHPLASRPEIHAADLAGERWPAVAGTDPAWRDFWTLAEHRGSGRARYGATVTSWLGLLEAVRAGLIVDVVSTSAAERNPTAGVVYRQVVGLEPCSFALGCRVDSALPLVTRVIVRPEP